MDKSIFKTESHTITSGGAEELALVFARMDAALRAQNTPPKESPAPRIATEYETAVIQGYEPRIADDVGLPRRSQMILDDDKGWVDWAY